MLNHLSSKTPHLAATFSPSLDATKLMPSNVFYPQKSEVCKVDSDKWEEIVQREHTLTNYPTYSWESIPDEKGLPDFEDYYTISRHLCSDQGTSDNICPYDDKPAYVARIKETKELRKVRDAYTLSALRFKLNPFTIDKSTEANKLLGIPTALHSLYIEKVQSLRDEVAASRLFDLISRQKLTLPEMKVVIEKSQQEMRFWYINELAPHMNANPLDPELHSRELQSEMMHDLKAYVELQNHPYRFFDLMQGLEKDVVFTCWQAAQIGELVSIEQAIVLVMAAWQDDDGYRRKKPIICPTGVHLGYMQALRRKDQPFITQEFSNHAHGGLNHCLQEHIRQRFCKRYPDKHRLSPSNFLKQLGYLHVAFPDAIYELHMPNVVNPANTNFWSVLQYYLPLMSPWP